MTVDIGGQKVQLTTTAAMTKDDDISTVATQLQTDLQTAVAGAMTSAGLTTGMEGFIDSTKVTVGSNQGKLVITSPGAAITFDSDDADAQALGLANTKADGAGSGVRLQIGANEGQTMEFGINDMSAAALGVDGNNVDLSTQDGASKAITTLDEAIRMVSEERGKIGAIQNRLEHTISNLDTSAENTQTAESRIRDLDMASEMVTYSKNNILQQAAQSMLAQANQSTQGVLSLLQ
jgi:flagellin